MRDGRDMHSAYRSMTDPSGMTYESQGDRFGYQNSATPSALERDRDTTILIAQLEEIEKLVECQIQRITMMADRLFGQTPEKVSTGDGKLTGAPPMGIMGEITMRVNGIDRRLNSLNTAISRLERI